MKQKLRKNPKLIFFFPVGEESCQQENSDAPRRGMALMVAIMIMSIMMMFIADFVVSSTVNLSRAGAQRDNIKAEYLAKSGANWALWLNLFDYGLQLQLGGDPAMKAMKDGIGTLWDKLNLVFPFDTGLDLSQVDKFAQMFGLSSIMDSAIITMLKSLGGELGVEVSDESGRINVNVCYSSGAECNITMLQLESLLTCTAVEQDYIRQNNIKPSELVRRIKDYIDKNNVAEAGSGYSDENDPYGKRNPPQKTKNSPLDDVNELLRVEGWTPEIHEYFSPYITVWPFLDAKTRTGFKININAMAPETLRCLFSRELNTPDAMEKFVKKYQKLMEDSGRIAGSDTELQSVIADLVGYKSEGSDKGSPNDRLAWLTTEAKTFRIKAKGIVGEQTRILEYVIQRSSSLQSDGPVARGPWSLSYFKMY
jgi:type II secretory pathway component PulK